MLDLDWVSFISLTRTMERLDDLERVESLMGLRAMVHANGEDFSKMLKSYEKADAPAAEAKKSAEAKKDWRRLARKGGF